MNKNKIRKIVDDFYNFIEIYYVLPNELQGLQRINPIISNLQVLNWYYHIQYNRTIEIYFGKDFCNVHIFRLSKEKTDFIEANININKDFSFRKEKNRVYNYLYNIELMKISYDFLEEIKEILIQIA